jgi:lysine biosynthesis protein LysW
MAIANCIECDEDIEINGRPQLGQKVTCPNCGALLEVASINPLELDWAEEDYDNAWDDDDFSDDEYEYDDEFSYEEDEDEVLEDDDN